MTIEDKAHREYKKWLLGDNVTNNGFEVGYVKGATDQRDIDVEKACEWLKASGAMNLSSLEEMVAEFRKAMGGILRKQDILTLKDKAPKTRQPKRRKAK